MMNNRGHLPAGQPLQGAMDMGPGPGPAPGVGVGISPQGPGSGGPRRGGRPHQPYPTHHSPYQPQHQHMNQHQPMYAHNYMPYAAPPYYSPVPPQYHQNGGMAPGYMPYPPQQYSRSPPMQQQYVPMVHQNYSQPPHHSPVVAAPYQVAPPPAPVPLPPQTPSSTHSSSIAVPPPVTSPVPSQPAETTSAQLPQAQPQVQPEPQPQPPQESAPSTPQPKASAPQTRPTESYMPKVLLELPWLSTPDEPFPKRTTRLRRRKKIVVAGSGALELPTQHSAVEAERNATDAETDDGESSRTEEPAATTPKAAAKQATLEPPPRSETPSTQDHPSEGVSTSPTTPTSVQPNAVSSATPTHSVKQATRPAVPAVPAVPVLPKSGPKEAKNTGKPDEDSAETADTAAEDASSTDKPRDGQEIAAEVEESEPVPTKVAPKLWTGLFSKASAAAKAPAITGAPPTTNGASATSSLSVVPPAPGFSKANSSSIAEAIQAYQVGNAEKLAFLEPRGLVNTGNMCYMNSVLQVLIFCIPFYDFLDQVSKKAAYSFKSETPLIDAMIMFIREFNVIDSATSVDQLRRRLKIEELEQYGEPFIPEFVYEAIRRLPRFASMRRGHQQDAEEFLGFLLEGLHDECAQVLRAAPPSTASTAPNSSLPSPTSLGKEDGDDWLEVGRKQKPSVTRSSGYSNISSPVTKIFGGQLRSELRVPGLKNSVTLEPYQPLQLDIGAPNIRNIVDALKGLTRPETLVGDFNSPHGKDAKATKQVFIESLPPVLILHLKRFQFDAEGHGTVKIWKKVGYPLELEIPGEVISRQMRNTALASGAGLPKYRLSAVVYHHGKNASGGHYTVDVRRQDGREWIRLDDTVIRRVGSEDVAEGGAEEDYKNASSQQDARKENASVASNRFGAMNDEDTGDDDGWKQAPANGKKWSTVVNGAGNGSPPVAQGPRSKQLKDSIKDNKVAYLLFYERI